MKKSDKFKRRCAACDRKAKKDSLRCDGCGNRSFVRYRVTDDAPSSAPVTERRDF